MMGDLLSFDCGGSIFSEEALFSKALRRQGTLRVQAHIVLVSKLGSGKFMQSEK
jgi:hypothetical protein